MTNNQQEEAELLKKSFKDFVWFMNLTATMIETGIDSAVYPGEDLHPHMWERLDILRFHIHTLTIDCRDLAEEIAHYLEVNEITPTEWQQDILTDLENLVKENQ